MDNFIYEDEHSADGLTISPAISNFLLATAKWGKFLAIIGFIGVGLMVLLAVFGGSVMGAALGSSMGNESAGFLGGFLVVFYLLFAVLYFFPVLYLYKFSVKMQEGLHAQNQEVVTESFENLKSLFKFMGILTAVILGFYGLIFIFGVGVAGISGIMN